MTTRQPSQIDYYRLLDIGPRWVRRDLLPAAGHSEHHLATPVSEIVDNRVVPIAPQVPVETNHHAQCAIAQYTWDELTEAVTHCQRCSLSRTRTHAVFGVGNKNARLMVVGEAPGAEEDKQGEPFVGQAGKLLDNMLAAIQQSRQHEVFIANVLKCRPPQNRNPQLDEVACCTPYLTRQITLVQPTLILAMGRYAVNTLLQTEAPISALRGRLHYYADIPVIVTYHPAYLLRNLPDKWKAWQDLILVKKTLAHHQQKPV